MEQKRKKTSRAPKKPITDHLVVEIALRRYSEGRILSLEELANLFDREKSVVSRCLTRAFTHSLVEVRPTAVPVVKRNESLERDLLTRFKRLRAAVVVTTEHGMGSDVIHADLGRAAARWMPATMVRNGDAIGVGSGRGVYHLIEALRMMPRSRASNISLVSLSGSLLPGHDSTSRNSCLDSDTNMVSLGPYFENQVSFRPVNQPLIDADDRKRLVHWADLEVSQAWVGLGILASEGNASRPHRLLEIAEKGSNPPPSAEFRRLLSTLAEAALQARRDGWVIAEVAHRFFLVPSQRRPSPPPGITDLVNRLNGCLFSSPPSVLEKCQSILLLAGTMRKAPGIQFLLQEGRLPIHVLVTDDQAAEAMTAN